MAQQAPQGGSRNSAIYDYIDLTGGNDAITDYVLFPYEAIPGSPGGFGIASRDGIFSQFTITNPAPEGALTIGELGVGIGIDGGNRQPEATMHIAGGDLTDPYGDARIFVEDRNSTAALRELLRMENNGGVGFSMTDLSTTTTFKMENSFGQFELASGPVQFRVLEEASNNSLNLAGAGIGVGTDDPTSTFHILADLDNLIQSSFTNSTITAETKGGAAQGRVQLSCINNGPSILSLVDTNRPEFSQWLITNTVFGDVDALSLRKNASGAPNFTIFEDGNIRFTFNGTPNCTIQPNGNLFVRGAVLSNSDRNLKENIKPVDPGTILEKVMALPISTWNYNYDDDQIPHIGPMAQDFHAAFGLGVNNKTIAAMDKDGVALAAIQGLNQKLNSKNDVIIQLRQDLEAQTEKLESQAARLESQSELIAKLSARLEALESVVIPSKN